MRGPDQFAALAAGPVRALKPYVPGKPISELERELGIQDPIKLASNENPLGAPVECIRAIEEALGDLSLYPDGSAFELKRSLAGSLNVDPDCLTIGNGSNEILSLLAETFLAPGDEAVYSEHAFVVYALAVQAAGGVARVAAARRADDDQPFGHDLAAMRALVNASTRIVFIANPNNPTGTWLDAGALRSFAASLPRTTLLVIDEAYVEYADGEGWPRTLEWLDELPNLIVTRTFSKIFGLAGLRIGYSVSHPGIAELINRVRQPFNVNALAQAAARAALTAPVVAHLRRSRELNDAGKVLLTRGLGELGWKVAPSAGNFVLANVGGPAAPWYERLLQAGVIVRPVASYGLPEHLRITIGLPEQNQRLLAAVRNLAGGGSLP